MCVVPKVYQALLDLIKWSAALCIVTAQRVLASAATSCRALMPKSSLSWWMGSLSPSNYRWFLRCIHYLLRVGCMCSFRGYYYTAWTAGGQLLCVEGVQGFLFQLCGRFFAIFMGISVLCTAQSGSASQITSFTLLLVPVVCMWLWALGILRQMDTAMYSNFWVYCFCPYMNVSLVLKQIVLFFDY